MVFGNRPIIETNMKKSLYVFLCSLLGALLFLILHRLIIFVYFMLISASPRAFSGDMSYLQLVGLDFFTLILALFGGMWYGIWLGLSWYEAVYERGNKGGFVDHLVSTYWPTPKTNYDLKERVESVAEELKDDIFQLEHLAKTIRPIIRPTVPVKRRAVRKRVTVKK